jgi:molybdenum cofactor guanylyltransferase
MRTGAIILCGGKSSRMGRDKATLPFGPELMLQRVVRLIGEAVDLKNVIVVAAANQLLPVLPADVSIGRDVHEYRGPLAGLAMGLRALEDRTDAVFVTGCDVPLLVPTFVERMFQLLGDFDIAVPFDGEFHHPLAAVYRPAVLAHVDELLASHRLSVRSLLDQVRTHEVLVEEFRDVDAQLGSLANVNDEQEYAAALAKAGLAPT